MRCKETHEWILQRKNGDRSAAPPPAAEQHLETCPECRELLRASDLMATTAAGWHDETTPSWQRPHLGFPQRNRPPLWYTWVPLAACLLLTALVVLRVEISQGEDGPRIRFGAGAPTEPDSREWKRALEQAVFQAQSHSAVQMRNALNQYRLDQEAYLKDILVQTNNFNESERGKVVRLLMDEWETRRAKDLLLIESQMKTLLSRQNLHRENLYSLASYVNKNQN